MSTHINNIHVTLGIIAIAVLVTSDSCENALAPLPDLANAFFDDSSCRRTTRRRKRVTRKTCTSAANSATIRGMGPSSPPVALNRTKRMRPNIWRMVTPPSKAREAVRQYPMIPTARFFTILE